jgi:hypothetical protein
MTADLDHVSCFLSRTRMVFIHSRGPRRFFGRSPSESGPEATVDSVEALASAGFDIVEFNMSDGKPLCTALRAASTWAPATFRRLS